MTYAKNTVISASPEINPGTQFLLTHIENKAFLIRISFSDQPDYEELKTIRCRTPPPPSNVGTGSEGGLVFGASFNSTFQ